MRTNYFDFLSSIYPEKKEYFNWIKYELDSRVYYYGNHFKNSSESKERDSVFLIIRSLIVRFLKVILRKSWNISFVNSILSEAYFTVNAEVTLLGFNVQRFPWNDPFLRHKYFSNNSVVALKRLRTADLNVLLDQSFINDIYRLKDEICSFLIDNQIRMIIFPNDLSAINRIVIDLCKHINIPTVVYLHGLPGRYNSIDDNRADYLFVWGEKIKENYVNQGIDRNKIYVTGHPVFSKNKRTKTRECNINNILVLTDSLPGTPSDSSKHQLTDRGTLLIYVYSVENALKMMNVKSARLRLHPCENIEWYKSFIDTEFFIIDERPLKQSLSDSSLIIGPTSTVLLDSVIDGIPYIVYEYANNKNKYNGDFTLVPPFDGSDKRLNIATNVNELMRAIKEYKIIDSSFIQDYVSDRFDISFIYNILNATRISK